MGKARAAAKAIIPRRVVRALRQTQRNLRSVPYILRQRSASKRKLAWPQTVRDVQTELPLSNPDPDAIRSALGAQNLDFVEGGHAFYLPPQRGLDKVIPGVHDDYPGDVGIKLVKSREISDDGTPYYTSSRLAPGSTTYTMRAVGGLRDRTVVANTLSLYKMGPRVLDIIRLRNGAQDGYAMVVQHIHGQCAPADVGLQFIERLRGVLDAEGMSVLGGFDHKDFRPPRFNDNLIQDGLGNCYLVDSQNLIFKDVWGSIDRLLPKAQQVTHFGESRLWRPAQYNYQSIPYLGVQGKRDMSTRAKRLTGMMVEQGIALNGSKILDIGCNLGVFGAYLLAQGAGWYVGMDRPPVVEVAQRLLYYGGYSRIDFFGGDLQSPAAGGAMPFQRFDIVLFLSMHKHIGWPDWFRNLEFETLVYEGHEGESLAEAAQSVSENMPGFHPLSQAMLQDGDSPPRPVLLCRRR